MAIKGLTDQIRYQRAGKIYLGIKEKTNTPCKCQKGTKGTPKKDCLLCLGTGFVYRPKELDSFVLTKVPELEEIYEKNPTELHVMLPLSWSLEQIFPQRLKRYGAYVLRCSGDGENAQTVIDGKLTEIKCPCEYFEKKACGARAIFSFRITELQNTMKVYHISTGSYNSIVNLNTAIRELIFFSISNRINIADIKLSLKRELARSQRIDDKTGRVSKGIHWPMTLDLDSRFYKSWREVLTNTLTMDPQRIKEFRAALPPPDFAEDALAMVDAEEVEEFKEAEKEALEKEAEAPEEEVPKEEKKEELPKKEEPPKKERAKTPDEEAFEKAQKLVKERDELIKEMNTLIMRLAGVGIRMSEEDQAQIQSLRSVDDYKKMISEFEQRLKERKEELLKDQRQNNSEEGNKIKWPEEE